MSKKIAPSGQLNFLLPIQSKPRQNKTSSLSDSKIAESRRRLLDDLKRAGF